MRLTQQQVDDFNREGWLFLPELYSPEEVISWRTKRKASTTPTARRYGARRAARRAPPLPRISTTRRSLCSARIRA